MSITIESDLKEILGRLETKLDYLQKDLTDFKAETRQEFANVRKEFGDFKLEIKQELNDFKVEVTKDLTEIKTKVNTLEKDVSELRGTQRAQVWAIISLLGVAVLSPFLRGLFGIIPFKSN